MNKIFQFIFAIYYRAKYGLQFIIRNASKIFKHIGTAIVFVFLTIKKLITLLIAWIQKQIQTTSNLYWFVIRNFIPLVILISTCILFFLFHNTFFRVLLILANTVGFIYLLLQKKVQDTTIERYAFLSLHQISMLYLLLSSTTVNYQILVLSIILCSVHIAYLLICIRSIRHIPKTQQNSIRIINFILTLIISCILIIYTILHSIWLIVLQCIQLFHPFYSYNQMNFIFLILFTTIICSILILTFTICVKYIYTSINKAHANS